MLVVAVAFFGLIAVNVRAIMRWKGIWRLIGAIPMLMMAGVIGKIIVDTNVNPTSHNLWPFEIIIWTGIGFLVLIVIVFLRSLMLSEKAKSVGRL